MANQINLTDQQIARLNEITSNGTANFANGYEYISGLIADNPNVDSYTKFFFDGARQVNGNLSTDANIYIRGVTEAGLAWDGKLQSDPEARRAQIQATSDDIGRNIFFQIDRDKGIPQLDDIIQRDASLAVNAHGQSVGGWAGGFYYWNAKFTQPSGATDLTVGEAILADPVQLEKFIAINAQALVDTSLKQGPSPDQIMTGWNSQAPAEVKAAILNRALDVLTGQTTSFAGNPYNIDGYVPIIGGDERPEGWRLGNGVVITDQQKINELNVRFDVRIEKNNDLSWQQLQRQGAIEQNPDGSKVIKFADTSDTGGSTSKVNVDANSRVDSVETAKDDGTKIATDFDQNNTQIYTSRTIIDDINGYLKFQQDILDSGNELLKYYDTQNTHPYSELDVAKNPTGKVTGAQVTLDPAAVAAGVGQIFGSAIGRALAPNDPFARIAISTVAGTIGMKFAQVLSASLSGNASQIDISNILSTAPKDLNGAAAGAVASFLVAELGEQLHLTGFTAQLFASAVGGFAGSLAQQIARDGLGVLAGAAWENALNAGGINVGGTLGSILAHEIHPAETQAGALGGQLLGAVGSLVGATLIGQTAGLLLDIIVPGIGSLIGTLLGTLIGDAFGGGARHPTSVDIIEPLSNSYSGNHWADNEGGDVSISHQLSGAVTEIVNAYLTAADGLALDHGKSIMIGYQTDNPLQPYITGWIPDVPSRKTYASAADAVTEVAVEILRDTEVIGGNLLLKRAHQHSDYADTGTLAGDLQVAQDYERYLDNRDVINAVMAANPDSAFTAGWIATFARVGDLHLNQYGVSDFFGGLVGYLDSVKKAGLVFDAASVSVKHGGGDSVIVEIKVPNGVDIPGALSVFASQTNQRSDASGTIVQLVFTDGLAAGNFHTLDSARTSSDASNDTWFGSDSVNNSFNANASANAILIGGASNDTLSGGNGWDFIDGGAGNDALFGGGGNDILRGGRGNDVLVGGAGNDSYGFARGDGFDAVFDDYWADVWVPGGGLPGGGGYEFQHLDGGADTLDFGVGISLSDLVVGGDGADLIVGVKDPAHPNTPFGQLTDILTLQHWMDADGKDRIEKFVFADGAVLNVAAGMAAFAPYQVPFGATLSGHSVAENSANGTAVGTVTGFDLATTSLSYSLIDDGYGRFAINASTGVVTVASGVLLDYEAARSHLIVARAADQSGHVFDKVFTINVGNVNERPIDATLSGGAVAENSPNGTVVAAVTGLDPDAGATLRYSLTDNAARRSHRSPTRNRRTTTRRRIRGSGWRYVREATASMTCIQKRLA